MPNPDPSRLLVLASSFYTAALEKSFAQALARNGEPSSVLCVPYNQLHTFLLDPGSVIPDNTPARVILFLRVEDLIRLELPDLSKAAADDNGAGLGLFRQRSEQFNEILGRISRLRLAGLMCPSGRGAYNVGFLGNAVRIAEHKMLATLRGQQRHSVFTWQDFERAAQGVNAFNVAGDRLGHVPFTPEGLDALAKFFVDQFDRLPSVSLAARSQGAEAPDLESFLAGLQVEMAISPLTSADETHALDLVRRTTHFVNLADRKWNNGDMFRLAGELPGGEGWIVRVRDRFGDYDISGTVTFGMQSNTMRVGLFFLTCPVLGKQVEHAFLHWLAETAQHHSATEIEIPFVQGRDNQGLCGLLSRLAGETSGMEPVILPAGTAKKFRIAVPGLVDRITKEAVSPAALTATISRMQLTEVTP